MTPTLACIPHEIAVNVLATLRAQAASTRVAAKGKCAFVAQHYQSEADRIEAAADAMFNSMTYRTGGGA